MLQRQLALRWSPYYLKNEIGRARTRSYACPRRNEDSNDLPDQVVVFLEVVLFFFFPFLSFSFLFLPGAIPVFFYSYFSSSP